MTSAVMKCRLPEDQFMVFNRSDLCIRPHQITHNPDGPVQHCRFLVRVMRKSKQPASDPKSAQFLDLPLKTLLMGRENAPSFSLWRLCHRNCRTDRPSLLFSLCSKHKQGYNHAIQMRRNAWRQVQAGNYTPCLHTCSATQWRLIYGALITEGDVTWIFPNIPPSVRSGSCIPHFWASDQISGGAALVFTEAGTVGKANWTARELNDRKFWVSIPA